MIAVCILVVRVLVILFKTQGREYLTLTKRFWQKALTIFSKNPLVPLLKNHMNTPDHNIETQISPTYITLNIRFEKMIIIKINLNVKF